MLAPPPLKFSHFHKGNGLGHPWGKQILVSRARQHVRKRNTFRIQHNHIPISTCFPRLEQNTVLDILRLNGMDTGCRGHPCRQPRRRG